jgi:hypothetical protein
MTFFRSAPEIAEHLLNKNKGDTFLAVTDLMEFWDDLGPGIELVREIFAEIIKREVGK